MKEVVHNVLVQLLHVFDPSYFAELLLMKNDRTLAHVDPHLSLYVYACEE